MDWKQLLAYATGTLDQELLRRNEYLVTENRILRQQITGRVHLTDAERKTLAEIGHTLGKKALEEVASIVKPDTILAWYHKLIAQKFDGSQQRKALGRPRIDEELEALVVRMAQDNRRWGYDRIAGALAHLGYTISAQTVGNILKRHGIPPAPERKHTTTWQEFIRTHMDVLVATDFFTTEVWTWCGLVTYYVLFFIHLESRKVYVAGVTPHPDERWMIQIARNITMAEWGFLAVLRKNSLLIALDVPSPSCDNRQEQPPMPQRRDTLTMTRCTHLPRHLIQLAGTLLTLLVDALHYIGLCLRSPAALAAENLFLRKQLALYRERDVRPRRATHAARLALIWLGRCFDWRQALAVVQPETFTRWHRQGFRLFWRSKSCPGRPPIPADLQALIRRMGRDNPSWGEERIANELLLKLGLRVSPRTVRKYLPKHPGRIRRPRMPSQRWQTFVRNHAQAIVACDFCVVVTATFHLLYVFVVLEHATRRVLHANVTAHPTAPWTLQQLRDAIPADHAYRFLIHDRDAIFSQELDQSVRHLGLRVLKTPVRSPQANALCERLLGTLRRECLDFLIPLTEHHLRRLLNEWVPHYNKGRPHMSLGPGIPQPPLGLPVPLHGHRHRIPEHLRVVARPILGSLHHEYRLEERAA